MSIASPSRNRTRASLVSMAALALALAGASFNVRAQSSADDSDVKCSATLISGAMVGETADQAYCRGYLGYSCADTEYANACNEGALARSRRGETGGTQGGRSEAEEMETNRRLVEQLPRLPPEANPLLGRWRKLPAPPPSNLLESLMGLGADVACTLIAGDGPSFEFREDALVHGARTMDSMRYYRGDDGVVFALGERYLRLLAFEFDGRDRIRNDTCSFERVGAVAAAASPSPSPGSAAGSVASVSASSAGPGCAIPTTRLGFDTVASVERDIEARGGSALSSPGGLAKFRVSTLSGDYADVGPNVMAVNYDFDASGPAGKMVAVTIVRHAMSTPEFDRMLAERRAGIAASVGPLQQKSATEFQASAPNCRLNLITNPATWFLHEIYQLPE